MTLLAAPSSLRFCCACASRCWKLASSASASRWASSRFALLSFAAARRALSSSSVSLGLLSPPVAERSPRTAGGALGVAEGEVGGAFVEDGFGSEVGCGWEGCWGVCLCLVEGAWGGGLTR